MVLLSCRQCKVVATSFKFRAAASLVGLCCWLVLPPPCGAFPRLPWSRRFPFTTRNLPTIMSQLVDKRKEWIISTLPGEDDEESLPEETLKKIPTHLVLHFDINETILLGDDAGGDSRHDSVQKMLAKSAFCQLPPASSTEWDDTQLAEPTHWWDGQPIGKETSLPPLYTGWKWPPNCCPYYRTAYKKRSKRFVDKYDGRIYKPVLEACEEALAKNRADNHILPAFYHTLEQLILRKEESSFQIVFRTFGSDIEDIAKIVTDFAQGKHPDYPHVKCPALELTPDRLYQGRWKCVRSKEDDKGSKADPTGYIYELWTADETRVVATGDEAILEFLSTHSICGIRDDYDFWKRNEWDPTAGKPVWVPRYDVASTYQHHLFFDDNIHNLAHDGIACVRRQEEDSGDAGLSSFRTLNGSTMHNESQGVHLVRVPTIEPVLNPKWYIEQIDKARHRLQRRLRKSK